MDTYIVMLCYVLLSDITKIVQAVHIWPWLMPSS